MSRPTKRERELFVLESCLSRLWGGRSAWELLNEQERPDFLVRDPGGNTLGVEVTELLTRGQGEARSLEGRLNMIVIDVLTAWLGPGRGADVVGYNHSIPDGDVDLEPFRQAFLKHLEEHGAALHARRGSIQVPFRHRWGEIEDIGPWDWPEIQLSGNGFGPHLEYMNGRPQQEIEAELVAIVERKVAQARRYDRSWPLWLVVRNPNQGIARLRPETSIRVRALAKATFQRVVLANLPIGTRDARPPFPYTIDLM